MKDLKLIDLAKSFSATPLGRTRKQGRFSGEAFREDHMKPALAEAIKVVVDLDGASGLSTGFLDEAFAGLVRDRTLTVAQFNERVVIRATRDPLVIEEIGHFVEKAGQQLAS